jgi:hypothetical protein
MKKLLIGLTLLASMSASAADLSNDECGKLEDKMKRFISYMFAAEVIEGHFTRDKRDTLVVNGGTLSSQAEVDTYVKQFNWSQELIDNGKQEFTNAYDVAKAKHTDGGCSQN